MLVSNFEVAWLDSAEGRRDETRYELQVTNLYQRSLAFQVRCLATPVEGLFFGSPATLDVSGGWLRYDELAPSPDTGKASQWMARIEPGESSTFRLLKRFRDWDVIRGTVELRVPALRPWVEMSKTNPYPYEYGLPQPQTDEPVPVLLHARRIDIHEAQSMQDEYRTRGHVGEGYSSEAVALASGQALVEIQPSNPFVMTADEIRTRSGWTTAGPREPEFPSGESGGAGSEAGPKEGRMDGALAIPAEERVPALLDLLASLGDDPAAAQAVNDILDHLGVPVRLRHQHDPSAGD
jgi:hypothetical protein